MVTKNGVEEFHGKDFNGLMKEEIVFADFFAEWCMPCVMMSPIIEEMAEKIKKVKFVKVNVDENSEVAGKFKVMSIPTMIIFKKGKEVERLVGSTPAETIEEKLKKHLK